MFEFFFHQKTLRLQVLKQFSLFLKVEHLLQKYLSTFLLPFQQIHRKLRILKKISPQNIKYKHTYETNLYSS